ncbi:hypothetical protein DPMN_044495 [Dreissena polymorpha]|uniref:Uncharacterized protein n=1 Tax=Dreissena polymorpha TaxID=45954 RepID=A0A9D4D325_DREPO|nr:hypothetical protein DPMN_044495 [Dreissena polymorpha]
MADIIYFSSTEGDDVTLTVRLVSEQMVTRNHRMQYKRLRDKLYEIWDRYENEYNTPRLLKESSNLVGTGPISANIEDRGEDEE